MMRHSVGVGLIALACTACGSVPAESGFDDVQALATERVGARLHWRRGSAEDAEADARIDALLAAPLTADAAVQIALLENRRLQATYERLGIAQADVVQAGLLQNPVFFGQVRYPDGSASGSNLELGVVQNFLDVLLRSSRIAIAEAQFEEVKLSVASEVVAFAAEVRAAYFVALGAEQVSTMRGLVVEAAEVSAELAHRLHEAGNISDLQLVRELGLYEDARVAWARADAERLAAREDLTRHVGLHGARTAWTLPARLPEIPADEIALDALEAEAIARRFDLAAAQRESEVLARALGVSRDWRFLLSAEVGVSTERDTDGTWVTGPELSLELPLFDRHQAQIASLTAELRRADHVVVALATEIRSEVRAARDRVVALRRLAQHYATVVIPMREANVAYSQEEYNYMLAGAFELILAKQSEYDAYQDYMEVVRDYWIARADLERAVGGRLGAPLPDVPEPEPSPMHDHGGH